MKLFCKALFAGMAISMAGIGYLQVGGLAGAVLFAWGLITVVQLQLKLFTGTAGFFKSGLEFIDIWKILLFNVIGCALASILFAGAPGISQAAAAIINNRLALGPVRNLLLSIGCGIIMTNAVYFAKGSGDYRYLPLLFGIPLFIVSGFPHCIADAFYIIAARLPFDLMILLNWLCAVIGNFIGCNVHRLLKLIK